MPFLLNPAASHALPHSPPMPRLLTPPPSPFIRLKAPPELSTSTLLLQSHGSKFKYFSVKHAAGSKDRVISFKCKSCLSVGAPFVLGPKRKLLKLSAFKSNGKKDEPGGRSKSLKRSIGVFYLPQESDSTLVESPKAGTVPTSYSSDVISTPGSQMIENLFKSWLMLLRVPLTNKAVDESIEEPASIGSSNTQSPAQQEGKTGVLNAVWSYFMALDATVKIPFLIFVPWYLAVRFIYGAEVSKELAPLWVFGPVIVALYIKLLRAICSLYVFSFEQTIKILRNLPIYYLVVYNYIARGKLKEDLQHRLLQPLVDFKNVDYKAASKQRIKDFEVFVVEKYLDLVESIWPFYCRTIRFLKRANLI